MDERLSRRRLLNHLGVATTTGATALAGCTSLPTTSADDDNDGPSLQFEASVVDAFSEAGPARIELTLGTATDRPIVVRTNMSAGQDGVFNGVWGQSEAGAELGMFRVDGYAARCLPEDTAPPIPEERVDGCWVPPCEEIELPSSHGRFELTPEEPRSDEYALLDAFNEACLPSGTYEFGEDRGGISARAAFGEVADSEVVTESGWYTLARTVTVTLGEDGSVDTTAEVSLEPAE
jgi:hypothetical protein